MEQTPLTPFHKPKPILARRVLLYVLIGIVAIVFAIILVIVLRKKEEAVQGPSELELLEQSSQPVTTTPKERATELTGLETKKPAAPSRNEREAELRALESN
jgi:hypothetical protein